MPLTKWHFNELKAHNANHIAKKNWLYYGGLYGMLSACCHILISYDNGSFQAEGDKEERKKAKIEWICKYSWHFFFLIKSNSKDRQTWWGRAEWNGKTNNDGDPSTTTVKKSPALRSPRAHAQQLTFFSPLVCLNITKPTPPHFCRIHSHE